MKKILGDIKAVIAELAGMVGGFFWARSTGWDYEPLILLVISTLCFIVSISLLRAKHSTEMGVVTTNNEKLVNEEVINGVFSRETPQSIMQKISQAPLFQMEEVARNFVGLPIRWHLKLFNIHRKEDTQIVVSLKPLDYLYPSIRFKTDVVKYPIFKIATQDKEFLIIGEIIGCTEHDITIKLSELIEK